DQGMKLNLWGYVPGNYFVPKPSYAAQDPAAEFALLVDELHLNGMELIMQFYFMPEDNPCFILEVLRYWARTYMVDGFQVMGADLPVKQIARDPYLSDSKLLFTEFDADEVYGRTGPLSRNAGVINDPFMYDMRKYLKGDEDMLGLVSKHILSNPVRTAVINHVTSYYGFTLKDLVSYERKHNEKNGEDGKDGSDYNYSWNCGDEGPSRKKAVNTLRLRQMKNAMLLLMLSQGVPMIRFGDEFGNSQKGNNNAWCQDNKISYLDWGDLDRNKELFDFTRSLIALRREHPVFRARYSKKMYDYISCGSPDVSFHGDQAWNQNFVNYNRHFAVMYKGAFEKVSDKACDDDFYVAYNMHWTGHRFHPPKPARGKRWEICMSSGNGREAGIYNPDSNELAVYARSIVVLRAI
ncbi:MAG: alpha-amylase, partial [Lachnospiraceae bacterium]|nr:alpha-amylase [Lachnospiraceae bacterium]